MNTQTRWGLAWMLAFIGFPLGGLLVTVLLGSVDNVVEALTGGALAGLVVGTAQMLALRQRLAVNWRWIVATAIGMAAGVGLSAALVGVETTQNAILLRAVLTGLVLSIAQWVVLRNNLSNSFWWIVVVTVVYTVAWFVTAQVIATNVDQGFVVFGASGALVFQAVTGLVLWWLTRKQVAVATMG